MSRTRLRWDAIRARVAWIWWAADTAPVEIGSAFILGVWGLWNLWPPLARYANLASFAGMASWAPMSAWGVGMVAVSVVKVIALLAQWRWGRIGASTLASMLWGVLSAALWNAPVLAPGAGITLLYLGGSLWIIFRHARQA